MEEWSGYFNWLLWLLHLKGSYREFLFYLFLSVLTLGVEWLIFLKFFFIRCFPCGISKDSRTWSIQVISDGLIGGFLGSFEELIFRAPILLIFREYGIWVALIAFIFSSILFAVIHFDGRPIYMIYSVAIGGLTLGFLVLLTRSLWPAIMLHFLWNLTVSINFYIYPEKITKLAHALQR